MNQPMLPPLPLDTPLPPVPPQGQGNDKLIVILCHLSPFLGVGLILPLIIYLVKKQDSPFIANHAREVINFHISLIIYAFACLLLVFLLVGILLLMVLAVISLVCPIIGAIKASEGNFFHYPLTIRLIK